MSQPLRLACLLGAAAVLAIAGPFNTDETIPRALPRLAYWGAIVFLCYSAGFASTLLTERLFGQGARGIKPILTDAVITASAVLGIILGLNVLCFGYWPTGLEFVILSANVVGISFVLSAVFFVADRQGTDTPDAAAQTPPILDRLPFDKRGALVALSVEDHYVRIRTTGGEEMILLRLSDAMREVGGTLGLQVHRSHWVALDQVTAAARKGDGAVLSLTHGPDIPVSRANVAKIKEAGLLPR